MSRRYQVFVSSTYEDLKDERNRVIQALLNINCIPCGMEYFPAADEDAWHCIERLIPECDYYVLILAGKYGSIPQGSNKSFTHMEYELAVRHKIPVLGLLHKRPHQLAADKCEGQPSRRRKLERFREQVARKLCRFWEAADQIPGELLASLTLQIDRYPRTGWVRADAIAADDAKNEIIKLQKRVDTQTRLLDEYKQREANEIAQLASGDEEFVLADALRSRVYTGVGVDRQSHSCTHELRATWNSVLRFIRSQIGTRWSFGAFEDAVVSELTRSLSEQNMEFFYRIHMPEAEIDKIFVQLSALGMIRQRGSTWELTAAGVTAASRLLAIKKGQREPTAGPWCSIDWTLADSKPYVEDVEDGL